MTDSERDRLDDPREVLAREIGESKAHDALVALHAAGFSIVPVEPTEAMLRAGRSEGSFVQNVWPAMIAAGRKALERKDVE